MKKKLVSIFCIVALLLALVTGCAQKAEPTEKAPAQEAPTQEENVEAQDTPASPSENVTLEVETGIQGTDLDVLREVLADFTAETGIGIELVTPGTDYEPVMKTRMAALDMPDVFTTHGWSVLRYSDFLRPLNDQPWAQNIDPDMMPAITDEDGNFYICPVGMNFSGYCANATVLEEAGVDVYSIITVEDFMDACQKVKDIGKTPIFLGGKDTFLAGFTFGFPNFGYFSSEGCLVPGGAQRMADGTFDYTTEGMPLFNWVLEVITRGFFNEDYLTADTARANQAMANDECAFSLATTLVGIYSYNPDADIAMLPFPAGTDGGMMRMVCGESNGHTYGVYKDSEHVEEGLKLLEFLARPENASRLNVGAGDLPGLTTTPVADDLYQYHAVNEVREKLAGKFETGNNFDRIYQPGGMAPINSDCLFMLLDDPTEETAAEAAEYMQQMYMEKYAAAG